MKRITMIVCLAITAGGLKAQQTAGKVTYDRTEQFQIRIAGMPGGEEQQMPQSRTDKFELTFGNNQSLWKQLEQENDDNENMGGGGVQIHMVMARSNDVLFTDLEKMKKCELREFFDKKFIIDDSIRPLKWKMTGETKTILNMPCMKATAINISTRTMMNIDNGKMERTEIKDTATIVAWFTSSIPVSAGPAEYQGQLPGLILEMDISNGRQIFVATGISEKADLTVIKEPAGKKHYTPDEFKKEREKMMEEMQKNNQGGNRVIRMN
jgi:GLPGLI family protein